MLTYYDFLVDKPTRRVYQFFARMVGANGLTIGEAQMLAQDPTLIWC